MRRIVCGISFFFYSVASLAATEPEGIPVGGAELIPTILIQHQHDDNIFSSQFDEQSSTITNLTPRLQYLAQKNGDNFLSVSYDGDWARYWQSRNDDYIDHTFAIDAGYSGSDAARFTVNASHGKLHDNRGEGASEGVGSITRGSPDEYDLDNFEVGLDLGRPDARFGASINVQTSALEYTTNRVLTQFRDRDDRRLDARLFMRLTGKMRGFVGYGQSDIEYSVLQLSGQSLDSQEDSVFAGIEWELTGKTSGNIRIGRLDKDFDDPAKSGNDISIWQVGVQWTPREYSRVSFRTSQRATETNGIGDFIEQTSYGFTWNHDWSERFHSTVSADISEDSYEGSARSDDRAAYDISLDYDWQRWANLGFGLRYDERESNFALFEYDRRQVYMRLNLSL